MSMEENDDACYQQTEQNSLIPNAWHLPRKALRLSGQVVRRSDKNSILHEEVSSTSLRQPCLA
jgi:hypothetical protein